MPLRDLDRFNYGIRHACFFTLASFLSLVQFLRAANLADWQVFYRIGQYLYTFFDRSDPPLTSKAGKKRELQSTIDVSQSAFLTHVSFLIH